MKIAIIAGLLLTVATVAVPALARESYVNGYMRHDGTYVQPHMRSAPDNTVTNNNSYSGNYNPNSGSSGTNNYTHDITSPHYESPDSQGDVGHQNPYGYNSGLR